ncbi:hypothetical protein ADZ37_24830 [Pannonibacter phragmitetus]|uniref:DUF6220 domain-containing protein n=1 Tax=Pannonibacter phragmitetus TaxID=121719 RepID=UPI00067BC4C9|nr:DUF6220 domain-containing protein [Pannonibacter phragmitetus]KND16127.1 hypothetical protein ADZ37_24830 [Pannonibacter phragmitetus]MBA4207644.1 hypothetical protein [Polymorphum sp.]
MTRLSHDTLQHLGRGTPAVYLWSARLLPVMIAGQFLLAGQALFGGHSWEMHGTLGGLAALPVIVLAAGATAFRHLRGFGWWAALVAGLYILQVLLGAGGPAALAFHPFNAALLLTASLILLFKVERRRSHHL